MRMNRAQMALNRMQKKIDAAKARMDVKLALVIRKAQENGEPEHKIWTQLNDGTLARLRKNIERDRKVEGRRISRHCGMRALAQGQAWVEKAKVRYEEGLYGRRKVSKRRLKIWGECLARAEASLLRTRMSVENSRRRGEWDD